MSSLPIAVDRDSRPAAGGGWRRHRDMAAVASVGIGVLVGVAGLLDYQRRLVGDIVRSEIAPLVVVVSEMDKRLSGKIDDTNRRIDVLDKRIELLDGRVDGLAKEAGQINVRVGRLEGRDSR